MLSVVWLLSGLNQCLENSIRWCTVGVEETKKCKAMKAAFAGENLSKEISCYQAEDHVDCMGLIKSMIWIFLDRIYFLKYA